MDALSGVIPILATPFRGDSSLDLESLSRLVEFQLRSGASALAAFGLASESFALSSDDRAAVLETTARVARTITPNVCIVAGVAGTGLEPALEQGRQAIEGGADALMVLPPFLVKPTPGQIIDFFGELAAAVEVPIMVQDAPATTNVTMSVALIAELGRLPWVDYVKVEAAPTAVKIADVVASASGTKLQVLGGQNAQFLLDELARGAVGTMPACDLTDLLVEVQSFWSKGRFGDAVGSFTAVLPTLIYGLQSGIAWAVHKEILVLRGIIDSPMVRAPARPLDDASRAGLHRVIKPLADRPNWKVSGNSLD